jgi:tetratricopeptide (TPR) repeat protein
VDRLERELANLRAALRWLLSVGETDEALGLASVLGYFWWLGGHLAEGRGWLDEGLHLDRAGSSPSRTGALVWSAVLAYGQGDGEQAEGQANAALALARTRGEVPYEAFAITIRGLVAWRRGETEVAVGLHREALMLARSVGDPWMLGDLLYHLGMAESELDPAVAVVSLTESLEKLRTAGGPHHLMLALGALADAHGRLGRDHEARALFREGLELGRDGADPITAVWMTTFAMAYLAERGRADEAMSLLAGLDAYVSSIGYQRTPLEQAAYRRAAAAAREQLGERAATAAKVSGAYRSPTALVRDALAALGATR